jgi:hypothetical protein
MKKILSIIALFVITFNSFAQDLNNYKYALVPAKFSFLKSADLYRMNTLTKMFMEKYGFETYLDSEILPTEFALDNCNKVFVDIVANNTMMSTKLKIVLKDCKNNILYTSEEGRSREKDYKVAYNQALRMAFDNFEVLKSHVYQPSQKSLGIIGEPAQASIKEEKVAVVVEKVKPELATILPKVESSALYAQPITNGFQLINTEPKVIYKIYKTSTKDFFIATKGTTQGVFFSKNNEWFFEYYQNDKLFSEKVEVKF